MNILIRLNISLKVKINIITKMYLAILCNLQWCVSDEGKLHYYIFKVKDLI